MPTECQSPLGAGPEAHTVLSRRKETDVQNDLVPCAQQKRSGQTILCRASVWVTAACAGVLLVSCASREFDDGNLEQSATLSARSVSGEGNDSIRTELRQLRISGADIHESDNKQPLHLKRLIDATVRSAEKVEFLQIPPLSERSAPLLLRPAGGFGSPIGTETYHLRGQNDLLDASQQQPSEDVLFRLRRLWLAVSRYGSQLGLFQTTRHLQNYFLVRQQTGTQKPMLDMTSVQAFEALQETGYWARPDDSAGGLSGGEKALRRNRALILLDLLTKVSMTSARPQLEALKSYLKSLAVVGSDAQMLWFRTHTLVRPPAGSDWESALGDFSVLAYSFAHISDLNESGFRLSVLSYDFVFGIHSWSKESTVNLLNKLCGEDLEKESLHDEHCDELQEQQNRLGNPSLSLLAQKGLANEFSVRGYSPVVVSSERISYASLNQDLFDQLTRDVQYAGSTEL